MTDTIVLDDRFENKPAKVVWKYEVKLLASPQNVEIPVGARLLHVEYIDVVGARGFLLWYEVDLKYRKSMINHVFQIWGTGDDSIPRMAKHVHSGVSLGYGGTRALPQFVWHLYEFPTGAKVVDV